MKKPIRITTLSLLLVFMILPVLSILMLHHITINETLEKMDSGSFGQQYQLISVNSESPAAEKIYQTMEGMDAKIAVTSDLKMDEGSVRGICFNHSYANLPMKKGRFFRKKDFQKNQYLAVVGKKKEESVYQRGSKSYILIQGVEFEVIGILGYECDTILDHSIFINGFVQDEIFDGSIYLVDFMSSQEAEGVMEEFCGRLSEQGIGTKRLSGGENFYQSLLPKLLYSRWFLLLFLCDLLCLFLLSVEWIGNQKQEAGIRRLLGATQGNLFAWIGRKYAVLVCVSIVTGFIYSGVFYPNYSKFLFQGYAILLPLLTIFFVITTGSVLNMPIEEAVK